MNITYLISREETVCVAVDDMFLPWVLDTINCVDFNQFVALVCWYGLAQENFNMKNEINIILFRVV